MFMKPFSHLKNFAAIALVAAGLVSTNASAAPVVPTTSAGAEDIIDILPPIHIAAPFPWLAVSAAAISLVGIGAVARKLLRRKRYKLAYEIALERLENTRPLMREFHAEAFCLAVSDVVREFIEEVVPVRAMRRTTTEFLRDLAKLPYLQLDPHRNTLANFLQHCDLAKFARWSLSVPQMEGMLSSSKDFVIDVGKPEPKKASPLLAENSVAATSYSPIS
jgi:hypothetical protein